MSTTRIPRKTPDGRLVDRFTLIAGDISAKKVTLSNTPKKPASVVVDLPCGAVQIIDADYEVNGSDVSWDGFGLETLLAIGDKLIITYT